MTIRASVRLLALIHAVAIGNAELLALSECCALIRYSIGDAVAVTTLSVCPCLLKTRSVSGCLALRKPTERSYRPAWISYSPTLSVVLFHMCVSDEIFFTHPPFFLNAKDKTSFHMSSGREKKMKMFSPEYPQGKSKQKQMC